MTDLVLPAAAPIETYVDEVVSVLAEMLKDATSDVLAGFDVEAQGTWAFSRPGAPPLRPSESLNDSGIVDGTLLTLVAVSRTERYRPLVEDVIDAIAVLDESPEFDRRSLLGMVGIAIPVVASVVMAVSLLAWSATGHGWWWAVALGGTGLGLLVGSIWSSTHYGSVGMAESLLLAAIPTLGGAAALAVPLPQGIGSLGAPQLAGASAVVLLLVLASRGGPRRRAELASFLAVVAAAVTGAAIAYGYGMQHWVPAGAVVFGLLIVTNAAKLTVAVARIALPPVPAPGESVSNDDLLDPVAGLDSADEESPTWQAIIASVPESAARLSERSMAAKKLLIGFVASGAAVLTAGAISNVVQGHFFVHSVVVAGLVSVICAFRSRLYTERWCAWALLTSAIATPTGVMVKVCMWWPDRAWLVLAIYSTLVLVALIAVGATTDVKRVSPIHKRALELLDGASIAAVIPLLLWIAGVYDLLRNLRF